MSRTELHLLQIFTILKTLSQNSYLVGGCVRDSLIGKTPKDFDIVTDIHMDKLEEAFQLADWDVKDTGKAFLVLTVSKDHIPYEIANFRKDGCYSDGRRPDSVEIGTIAEDAARRDFTVNALYMDPFSGEIRDPTGKGLDDIKSRTLRFIGKPKDRIQEDYLRVFRFYRFLKKGFKPDKKSLKACRELFNEAYLKITPERVRTEVEKMVL